MKSSKTINFTKTIIAVLFIGVLFSTKNTTAQNVLTYKNPFAVEKFKGGLDTADIDGDGDLDILYSGEPGGGSAGATTMHLYKNDGAGNFTEVTPIAFAPIFQGDLKFADVDGDGDQDVLMVGFAVDFTNSIFGNSARLYLNDGTGNFTYKSGTPFAANNRCKIAFADVDSDNDLDVCIVGEQSSALYLNDGSGNFSQSTTFGTLSRGHVTFGDINGDNHLDLLMAGQNSSNVSVTELYTNNGSGTFTLVNGTSFHGISEGELIIKDIDSDNDNDIFITGLADGSVGFTGIYWNDGASNFTLDNNTSFIEEFLQGGVNLSTGSPAALIEDFDGDNDLDIMMADYFPSIQGKTRIYINDGNNKFHQMQNIWMPDKHTAFDLAYGDLDGDGIKDFVASGESNNSQAFTRWYKNTQPSRANKAIDFDGTNIYEAQHIKISNTAPLNTIPLTVEFWVKIPTTDTDIGLIKKTDGANDGFEIYTTSGILYAKYSKDASNHVTVQSATTVNDDAWHHFAFTVDNSNANLYIDGILIQTTAWTGTAATFTNENNLIFGQGTNNYNGLLDEVRIWNTARTISQIRENMYNEFAQPTDESTLIANYTMNVYTDSLIMDVSQYYNRAAISGGSVTLVDELINFSNTTSNTNTGIQNTTVTIGKITLDDESANGNDPYDAPIQIVVAEVEGMPNVTTGIMEPNINNRYYIIQSFDGAGTFSVDISVECAGCIEGQGVSLYGRNHHSTGNWGLFTTGTVTGGKAVFQNAPFFSQIIMASNLVLPVELLSFTGQLEAEKVVLNWQTATEINNSHFEVEYSTDGFSFEKIGEVQGAGTTNELQFYEFTDDLNLTGFQNRHGLHYYRLKQVDFDGTIKFSEIININIQILKQSNTQTIKIYPNPTSNVLMIETNEPTFIKIFNINGQVILEKQITENEQLDISNLKNGFYFIKIGNETQKILIQH